MSKGIAIIFACFLSLGILAAEAQTVDDIVAKYEAAMGGRDKLASIQSVHLQGVSVMQNGNEINSDITKVNNALLRTDVNFGMGSFSMVVTPKEGWASNPRSGGKFEPLPEDAVKAMQTELDLSGPLANYAAKGHKAELLGKETLDGKDVYKIKLTLNTGKELTYFIDANTFYIVREQREAMGFMGRRGGGQGGQDNTIQTIDYSDFQKTDDGYVFPFSIKRSGMGGNMVIEKIEVNQPVDPKKYKPE